MAIMARTKSGNKHFLEGNSTLDALRFLEASERGSGWWSPRDFLGEVTPIRAKEIESLTRVEDEAVKDMITKIQEAGSRLKIH